MKIRILLAGLICLCLVPVAFAHRLNEYLQATTIDLQSGHIRLGLRMTPGVDVAKRVIAAIDTDGNGVVSPVEAQSYADRVRHDLALSIGNQALSLRFVSSSFPTVTAMKKGLGDIVLSFEADAPGNGIARTLTFTNRHERDIAAYLVNCLAPSDPTIQVTDQDRNKDQSFYRLQYTVGVPQTAESSGLTRRTLQSNSLSVVQTYFWHGIHHILTGYDHLLFICALVLGASTLWDLVKVVTAFTVAHSFTLTLAALNLVHMPDSVVEPLISASIVFVAVQNIFWPDKARGASRLAVAFFFGLFHGLGFAGGLLDLMHHMPTGVILLAILGFSLGVEAGNQLVLLPLFGLLKAIRATRRDPGIRQRVTRAFQSIGSAGISVAGAYYLVLALIGTH